MGYISYINYWLYRYILVRLNIFEFELEYVDNLVQIGFRKFF